MSKSDFDRHLNGGEFARHDIEVLSADGLRVNIVGASLPGVNLSRLDLSRWRFESCDLAGTSFDRSSLEEAVFVSCRGAASSFVGADMQEAVIEGGDFHNASFLGASLGYVRLLRCKATGANFTDAKTFNIHMEEVKLSMALMPKASFRKNLLKKIDFTEADLAGCDFREAVFEGSSLRNAILDDCRFEKADLRGADLGGIALRDAARFKGAVISSDQAADLVRQLGLKVE